MASLIDIRRRIKSVKNTQQITKAMKMIAAARLRRSQDRVIAARPYARTLAETLASVVARVAPAAGTAGSDEAPKHPLLASREEKNVLLVVVTGDRGLAGAFNAQVLRRAFALERELRRDGKDVRWLVVGKKGTSTLRFRRYEIEQSFTGFADRPTYSDAQTIAHRLAELYAEGEVDRVVLVYNAYVSPLVQTVTVSEVLPIPESALEADEEEQHEAALRGDFIYEPEPEEILARLLPVYVETEVYRALLESSASFLGAQMTAMRNATKSAGELMDTLTLAMNRARQAAITQEILEVVGGADALTA
jgi:F-type H+-transporting ATPase subunit gamma